MNVIEDNEQNFPINIHLVNDEKFITKSVERFELYYPGKNIFFVCQNKKQLKHVEKSPNVIPISLLKRKDFQLVLSYCSSKTRILVHFLNPLKAWFVLKLKKRHPIIIYWLFYGADLYQLLKNRNIYDYSLPSKKQAINKTLREGYQSFYLRLIVRNRKLNRVMEQFIYKADYFCFWNPYDYELLKTYYPSSSILFKYFGYYSLPVSKLQHLSFKKENLSILINHSASRTGNHNTIFKQLASIDKFKEIKKIVVPLSYGSREVVDSAEILGKKYFSDCFYPIKKILPKSEYFENLQNIAVAIFGHNRQEASGNIEFLLGAGTKVFLRSQNNLLKYYRELGFIIYEYESELKTIKDLAPLELDDQKHNRKLIFQRYSKENLDKMYSNLFL